MRGPRTIVSGHTQHLFGDKRQHGGIRVIRPLARPPYYGYHNGRYANSHHPFLPGHEQHHALKVRSR